VDYPGVYDYETLARAAATARDILKVDFGTFFNDFDENIISLQNHLIWKSYKPSPFDNGIDFSFRDIVVQVALCYAIDESLIPLAGKNELFYKLITYPIDDIDILKLVNLFLAALHS